MLVRSTYKIAGTPYIGTIVEIAYNNSGLKQYANITNGAEVYTDFLSDLEHIDIFVKLERMLSEA